jgi:hypothetical protein
VLKANRDEDRDGIDWWVECVGGQRLAVDLKARLIDYAASDPSKDDLALELWSVCGSKIGWTRDILKRTDYVLWLWQDMGRWCLLPFKMLSAVFIENLGEWEATFFTPMQTTRENGRSWQSQCVFVPRNVVWRAMYERFGGMTCKP